MEKTRSVASAYLSLLASRGVEVMFGNAGTDFAPVIEAFAAARRSGAATPRPVLATHENLAVTMAHGYAMLSRKIPAVMVHVSVGTANMVCAAMNASRENVPLLLTAGRTPLTESGMPGSRDGYIHWAQEMYDQAGLVRETTKWQYELHNGAQLQSVVDRALAIAASEPKGPVYLSLPREVIAAPVPPDAETGDLRMQPAAAPGPDANAIQIAADMIAEAKAPLIVTANAGREKGGFEALAAFAERFAIPVVQHKPRYPGLPSSHPMNLGFEPSRRVGDADLIIALETDVPWIPKHGGPEPDCPVVQCGVDPMYSHIPIRSFASDIAIAGSAPSILSALGAALEGRIDAAAIAARAERAAALRAEMEAARLRALEAGRSAHPLHPAWISHCIGAARDPDGVIINEYTLLPEYVAIEKPDSYFGSSSVSGLGWGAGAALGAKLAAPEREVVAVLGDGAYMFSNPAAVHHAAAMHKLPVLFVVMNNSMWGAVRRSTVAMYPDSGAAMSNDPDFVHLHDLPAFETICESAGGYGERVDDAVELPAALERALKAVREEKRQALLNVICAGPE